MTARHPDHPVDPQFPARWSPRSFAADTMSEAEVLSLLEAARWAPSASNHQPARFAYGLRGDASFATIFDALMGFNTAWAGKAAALIVVASRTTVAKDDTQAPNAWHAFDAGAAWMSLALQAQAMGLVAHAMGGFEGEKLAPALELPEGHHIHVVVAVGRKGDIDDLPEKLQAREMPSPRRPVAEVAARGRFPA